jgi:hypothetical protein
MKLRDPRRWRPWSSAFCTPNVQEFIISDGAGEKRQQSSRPTSCRPMPIATTVPSITVRLYPEGAVKLRLTA